MSDPILHELGGAPAGKRSAGTRVLEVVCAILLAIMVLLLSIQVFGRYVFQYPPEWTEELARTAFVYATFVGASLAIARNAHLRIDSLVNLLPRTVQPWVRAFATVAAIVFLGYVLYYSSIMLPKLAFQPLTAVPFLSKAWFFAAVPVGCALMLLYEVHRLWLEVRAIVGGAPARS